MTKAYYIVQWMYDYEVHGRGRIFRPDEDALEDLKPLPLEYIRLQVYAGVTSKGYRNLRDAAGVDLASSLGVFVKLVEFAGNNYARFRGWILQGPKHPQPMSIAEIARLNDFTPGVTAACVKHLLDARWIASANYVPGHIVPTIGQDGTSKYPDASRRIRTHPDTSKKSAPPLNVNEERKRKKKRKNKRKRNAPTGEPNNGAGENAPPSSSTQQHANSNSKVPLVAQQLALHLRISTTPKEQYEKDCLILYDRVSQRIVDGELGPAEVMQDKAYETAKSIGASRRIRNRMAAFTKWWKEQLDEHGLAWIGAKE